MTSSLIAHSIAGSGDPLVLLNGGLMSMGGWGEIASSLEREYMVVRCDFRGQLLSPGDAEPSITAHADDVIALLDALQIDSAHLVGTSFGGFVGVQIAADHPRRVRSLVAATITDHMTPEMTAGAIAVEQAARRASEGEDLTGVLDLIIPHTFTAEYMAEHRERFAMQRTTASFLPPAYYRGVAAITASIQNLDLRPLAPRVSCPALIVAGGEDRMFLPEHSRSLAALMGAGLQVMEGAPHGLVVERAAEFTEIIRAFLATVRANTTDSH